MRIEYLIEACSVERREILTINSFPVQRDNILDFLKHKKKICFETMAVAYISNICLFPYRYKKLPYTNEKIIRLVDMKMFKYKQL